MGDEFQGVSKFIPITYKDQWAAIREIQSNNGVEYTPPRAGHQLRRYKIAGRVFAIGPWFLAPVP